MNLIENLWHELKYLECNGDATSFKLYCFFFSLYLGGDTNTRLLIPQINASYIEFKQVGAILLDVVSGKH